MRTASFWSAAVELVGGLRHPARLRGPRVGWPDSASIAWLPTTLRRPAPSQLGATTAGRKATSLQAALYRRARMRWDSSEDGRRRFRLMVGVYAGAPRHLLEAVVSGSAQGLRRGGALTTLAQPGRSPPAAQPRCPGAVPRRPRLHRRLLHLHLRRRWPRGPHRRGVRRVRPRLLRGGVRRSGPPCRRQRPPRLGRLFMGTWPVLGLLLIRACLR